MKSLGRQEFIDRVEDVYTAGYSPSEEVLETLGGIGLVTITGPSGVGKDTLRRKLALPIVISDTIREPRANNGRPETDGVEYYFRGHKLAKVWKDVKNGRYVQFTMGPNQQGFYGSHIKRYPETGRAVIDVMSDQLEALRNLPFSVLHNIYVVPQSFEAWNRRFSRRGEIDAEDLSHRYAEAKTSLRTALGDSLITFIINEDVRRAAHDVRGLIYDGAVDADRQSHARAIGEDMLSNLELLIPGGDYSAIDGYH